VKARTIPKCDNAYNMWILCSVFFSSWGFMHYVFILILTGLTVNKKFYLTILQHLQEQCKRNILNYGKNTTGFFNITLPHTWYPASKGFSQETKHHWFHSHPTALISLQLSCPCSWSQKLV
jgi:hypothetical protein